MPSLDESRRPLLSSLRRALARTTSQTAAFSQALAAQLGIGPTDLECLAVLQELGPSTAGQLADVLSLTTGAITGVVDRLEASGFVVRESDPGDRRRVIVRAVDARMADIDAAYEPLMRAVARSLEAYTEQDLRLVINFERRAYEVMLRETARMKAEQVPSDTGAVFSAPLGDAQAACLEFATGASQLRISALDGPDRELYLYRATFEGPQPSARVHDGNVVFRYRRVAPFDWARHTGVVGLNPSIPWGIVLTGGASNVALDARGLQLRELKLDGGASKVDITLGAPRGTVPVRVVGGLVRMQIVRPADVPAQIQVRGGANRLEFDGQRFGAIGGDVRLASPGWEAATDRYAIEVHGGASRLDIHEVQEVFDAC